MQVQCRQQCISVSVKMYANSFFRSLCFHFWLRSGSGVTYTMAKHFGFLIDICDPFCLMGAVWRQNSQYVNFIAYPDPISIIVHRHVWISKPWHYCDLSFEFLFCKILFLFFRSQRIASFKLKFFSWIIDSKQNLIQKLFNFQALSWDWSYNTKKVWGG